MLESAGCSGPYSVSPNFDMSWNDKHVGECRREARVDKVYLFNVLSNLLSNVACHLDESILISSLSFGQ